MVKVNVFYFSLLFLTILFLSSCNSYNLVTEFKNESCISPLIENYYLTCKNINFSIENEEFIIPKDFVIDFNSIPSLSHIFISSNDSALVRSAIVHDWFYTKSCDFTRFQSDNIFYYMLINENVPKIKAMIIYYLVRIYGWQYYSKDYCE